MEDFPQFIQKTNEKNFEEERKQKIISKHLQYYSKCLQDLTSLINAVCLIYPIETISSRLREMLEGKEKLDLDILSQIQTDMTINNQNNNENVNAVFESIGNAKKI